VRLSFKHACSLAVLALSVAHSARAATNIDSCRAITEPGTYKLTKDPLLSKTEVGLDHLVVM
jgi:hypothetical protein